MTMSLVPLLTLLGVTLMLSRVQALTCQKKISYFVYEATEPHVQWTANQEECQDGWGCQDTVMFIKNGLQVNVVLTKGCTPDKDQEARVTEHRAGPGLSIVSYTHVCRQANLCNNLSSSSRLWAPSPTAAPAKKSGMRCPTYTSRDGCPESEVKLPCPEGLTHCYNGVLTLSGGGIVDSLTVQGCIAQAGCNLLNGTRKIGPISVSENCNHKDSLTCQLGTMLSLRQDVTQGSGSQLTCQVGTMLLLRQDVTQGSVEWTASGSQLCEAGKLCQETLLIIDTGYRSLVVGRKGCASPGTQISESVSIHSRPPAVLVASYFHACSSNGCNRANSISVLVDVLPPRALPATEGLTCPVCVELFGSCSNSKAVICPEGSSHCYKGSIELLGSGLSSTVDIQGCMTPLSKSLLNNTKTIGSFSVNEIFEDDSSLLASPRSRAAPAQYLAWVVGIGLSLAFRCGGFCLPY